MLIVTCPKCQLKLSSSRLVTVCPKCKANMLPLVKRQPVVSSPLNNAHTHVHTCKEKTNDADSFISNSLLSDRVSTVSYGSNKQPSRSLTDKFTSTPHVSVEALAGTGKTFTIIEQCYRLLGIDRGIYGSEEQEAIWSSVKEKYKPDQIMLTTFSSRTAKELKARVPPGMAEKAGTLHAFGKRVLGFNKIANRKNDFQSKKSLIMLASSLGYSLDAMFRNAKKRTPLYYDIDKTIAFLKLNLVDKSKVTRQLIIDTIDAHGYILAPQKDESETDFFFEKVSSLYVASFDETKIINFDDMLFLPWALQLPIRPVDFLFVDERQDLNIAQQDLACRLGNRMFLAGDTNQAIYGFAGADTKASARLEERLSLSPRKIIKFPLTFTRRCSKAVVEYAKQFVPEFNAFDDARDGRILNDTEDTFVESVKPGDMVICRTNAPLFSVCLKLMRRGIPFSTTVSDSFRQVKRLIESFECDDLDALYTCIEDWYEIQSEKATSNFNRMLALSDTHSAIVSAITNASSYSELMRNFQALDSSNSEGENVSKDWVFVTSIHGSKGLEADKVWWLQYDLVPHPKAKLLEQERNLQWVASTRSKDVLVLVHSQEGDDNDD